jgi:hypothetical protein
MNIEFCTMVVTAENHPGINDAPDVPDADFPDARLEPDDDPLPEHCHYRDEGCELAESCLNCPFSRCIYDEPGGKQHFVKTLRDREIRRRYRSGSSLRELAALFGISQRTVHRALKKVEND